METPPSYLPNDEDDCEAASFSTALADILLFAALVIVVVACLGVFRLVDR